MIYVIDDDEIMAECIARACEGGVRGGDGSAVEEQAAGGAAKQRATRSVTKKREVRIFTNAIEAVNEMAEVPDLIFLDIMLTGPDGFTFLNELASYPDTVGVPVVIVTSLDLTERDLAAYGVVGILHKDKMRPEEIRALAEKYDGVASERDEVENGGASEAEGDDA